MNKSLFHISFSFDKTWPDYAVARVWAEIWIIITAECGKVWIIEFGG